MPYDPNQPRVPAGNENGGEWTSESSASISRSMYEGAGLPLNMAGGWKSKYQDIYDKYYELGKMAAKNGYSEDDNWHFIPEYQRADYNDLKFFHAGYKGVEKPYPVIGWRYGNFGQFSINYAEQRPEAGISMMEVWGVGKTQDPLSAMFISAKHPDVKFLRGYINTEKKGGDGEPLMFAAEEITKAMYEQITGVKFVESY